MKLKILFNLIIFLLFSSHAVTGQLMIGKALQEKMKEAERSFNTGNYDFSKNRLEEILKEKENFAPAIRLLGLIHLRTGKLKTAADYYNQLFKLKSDLSRAAYFEAAEVQMKLYKYDKALEYFLLYKHSQNKDYKLDEASVHKNYERYIDINIESCDFSLEMEFKGEKDQPEILSEKINSKADEYLPTLTANGDLLLFTTGRDKNENIMLSKLKDGEWTEAVSIGNAINTPYNEGMAKFTTCGRKVYFSACAWENVQGGCDIYMAEYDTKDQIIDQVEPAKGLNSESWDSQPSISCNGDVMFFSSTREGGFGGTDIWMSTMQLNGIWGPAVNLGSTINTKFDEEAPFIAPDGITLYFSSDGHPGMGESDIFKTVRKEDGKSWTLPQNLGESVNSPFREAGLVISPDHKFIYFSSARLGGKGGLDIYKNNLMSAQKPQTDHVLLDGYIYDEISKEFIEGANVRVRSGKKSVGNFKSDKDGRFFMCVPTGASYSYIVDKKGYDNFIGADYFERTEDEMIKRVEIFLTPNNLVIDETPTVAREQPQVRQRKNLSVYFESGLSDLSEVQKEQIKKLITQFDNPSSLKINVTGYADDIGDVDFNLTLSKNRAEVVKQYILEQGLSDANLKADGKGIVETNMAKHQKRRVEIIILD